MSTYVTSQTEGSWCQFLRSMSVALSLIASSKKYPLNLGFSKKPWDLVVHKPFKYERWGPNPLWLFWQIHFKSLLIFTFNLSSKETKLWISPSSTLTAFSIWHWALTLCHSHVYAYMHMNTHANTYRQNHWNGLAYGRRLAGTSNTHAGTCHRGDGVEMKSMQRLRSLLQSPACLLTFLYLLSLTEDVRTTTWFSATFQQLTR